MDLARPLFCLSHLLQMHIIGLCQTKLDGRHDLPAVKVAPVHSVTCYASVCSLVVHRAAAHLCSPPTCLLCHHLPACPPVLGAIACKMITYLLTLWTWRGHYVAYRNS
jgi:hypothetical protein